MKAFDCILCGKKDVKEWGNNPAPLGNLPDKCCSICNMSKVIPARLGQYLDQFIYSHACTDDSRVDYMRVYDETKIDYINKE